MHLPPLLFNPLTLFGGFSILRRMSDNTHSRLHGALVLFVRPLVAFLLQSGISYKEFSGVCKEEYVRIASESYGLRGRPTNASRIAAMTGLTRKEVKSVREASSVVGRIEKMDNGGFNAPTVVLHYWHSDRDFLDSSGKPRELKFDTGSNSFVELCRRYSGDIPAGALRTELKRAGAITETSEGRIKATRRYYTPERFNSSFARSMGFSLSGLVSTLMHNARLSLEHDAAYLRENGYLERYVWSSRLRETDIEDFRKYSESKVEELLAELDSWIGSREQAISTNEGLFPESNRVVGLGTYFFRTDSEP